MLQIKRKNPDRLGQVAFGKGCLAIHGMIAARQKDLGTESVSFTRDEIRKAVQEGAGFIADSGQMKRLIEASGVKILAVQEAPPSKDLYALILALTERVAALERDSHK